MKLSEQDIPRCQVTHNICGTDTWAKDKYCTCLACRGYVYGREALEQENDWISVEDRLPEHNRIVIGTIEGQVIPVYYHYPVEIWYASIDEDMKYKLDITHWMPLPEPPMGDI